MKLCDFFLAGVDIFIEGGMYKNQQVFNFFFICNEKFIVCVITDVAKELSVLFFFLYI